MTDVTGLLALAERCEAASGADDREARHLGREVLLACGKGYVPPLYAWLNPMLSLDAAMTLVLEGHRVVMEDGEDIHRASVRPHGRAGAAWNAASLPLALCAAALRARASAAS